MSLYINIAMLVVLFILLYDEISKREAMTNKKPYQKPEVEKLVPRTVRVGMNLVSNHRRKNTAFYDLEPKP